LNSLTTATGFEAHGITINPLFAGITDLHINSAGLCGIADTFPVLADDIDGDIRNIQTSIGADECGGPLVINIPSYTSEITAYPSPADKILNLSFHLQSPSPIKIEITDCAGRVCAILYVTDLTSHGEYQTAIPVDNLMDGIYLVRISSDKNNLVTKVVIENNP
jgi:hypothetical protein